MSSRKQHCFRAFLDNIRGIATIEFALVGPVLVALLIFSVNGFDSYRGIRKASSTVDIVADLVSRKQVFTSDEAENLFVLTDALLDRYATREQFQFIISSIEQDEDDNYVVIWSVADGPVNAHENFLPDDLTAELPEIPAGESIIVTELDFTFRPTFQDLWVNGVVVDQFSIARPRLLAKIAYDP